MSLLTVLFVLSALVALIILWGEWSSRLVLRAERDALTATPRTFNLPFVEETFFSEDHVSLRAWFIPAAAPTDVTLVLCHGWGANRSDILERTHFLRNRGGYNLFLFDFRNHGESGAGCSSLSRYEIGDLQAALRHLRAVHPAGAARVGLYGMSFGGAVSLWAAAQDFSIAAVAAESTFFDFNSVVTRFAWLFYNTPDTLSRVTLHFVRRRLGFDPNDYAPFKSIGRIAPRPVLILHGDRDARVPRADGQRLFEAAGNPKSLWTVPGADHGEVAELGGREYQDRVLAFFSGVFGRPA